MVAQEKISEAEYFLNKITIAQDRYDFLPNLSAFMSATRSIPDYLLEDYNTKLGLGISLTDKLYPSVFETEAKNQNNQTAINFIADYKTELANLYKDPVAGFLIDKRNIVVHRKNVPISAKFSRSVSDTIIISESISVEVRDKDGNLKSKSQSVPQTQPQTHQTTQSNPTPSDGVEWSFPAFTYSNDNVITICIKFLDIIKKFVSDLQNKYP